MTKQEEIREAVAELCCGVCEPADRGCEKMDGHCKEATDAAKQILSYLHSQGVVIQVDEEPSEELYYGDIPPKMYADGWRRFEPLIEEGKCQK